MSKKPLEISGFDSKSVRNHWNLGDLTLKVSETLETWGFDLKSVRNHWKYGDLNLKVPETIGNM